MGIGALKEKGISSLFRASFSMPWKFRKTGVDRWGVEVLSDLCYGGWHEKCTKEEKR